jgi:hypothetical protein
MCTQAKGLRNVGGDWVEQRRTPPLLLMAPQLRGATAGAPHSLVGQAQA